MADTPNFWCHKCQAPVHLPEPETSFACPTCTDSFLEAYTPPAEDPVEFQRAQAFANSPIARLLGHPGHHEAHHEGEAGPDHAMEAGGLLGAMMRLVVGAEAEGHLRQESGEEAPHGRHLRDLMMEVLRSVAVHHEAQDDQDQESLFESLPDVTVQSDDAHAGKECPVCQEIFADGDECKQLPCNHLFHNDCIQPWLQMKSTCPLCRQECRT
eukprot:m.52942 g.52942  ORF g.52942 m.52942 type:complete len:212 (+) comp13533_c0_seq1:127-762(+)